MNWSLNHVRAIKCTRLTPSFTLFSKSTKLTFIETLADFILSVRITHLHMLVVISQLVYALLAERHQEHIYRDTCDSVILRLDVSVLPFRSMSFWFALPALELAGIWQWL